MSKFLDTFMGVLAVILVVGFGVSFIMGLGLLFYSLLASLGFDAPVAGIGMVLFDIVSTGVFSMALLEIFDNRDGSFP